MENSTPPTGAPKAACAHTTYHGTHLTVTFTHDIDVTLTARVSIVQYATVHTAKPAAAPAETNSLWSASVWNGGSVLSSSSTPLL